MLDPIAIAAEASTPDAFERAILASLARDVGFDVAFTALLGARPSVLGLDREVVTRALTPGSGFEDDLMPVKRAALAARAVAVDTDVLGERRVHQTRYFRELAAPIGGRHTLMAYFRVHGRVVGGVMLGRTSSRRFSDREIAVVEEHIDAIAIARASYALPPPPEALPRGPRRWLPFADRIVDRRASSQGEIVVRDRSGFREMVARAGADEMIWTRSNLDDPSRSGWPYVELFTIASALATQRRSALFVGCGGGVAASHHARMFPGAAIDIVEPDPVVVDLARAWFALDAIPNVEVHIADGASFLARTSSRWDVIVVDAYDASSLAAGVASRAFFASIRRALHDGGAVAINVVASLDGAELHDITRAMSRELTDVRVVPVMTTTEPYAADALRNVVVVARR